MDDNTRSRMVYEANRKDVLVAYLIWFFLSWAGAHRFYLGHMGSGAAQLGLLVGGMVLSVVLVGFLLWFALGVWILIDAFLIPSMVRDHNVELIGSI